MRYVVKEIVFCPLNIGPGFHFIFFIQADYFGLYEYYYLHQLADVVMGLEVEECDVILN